MSYDGRAVANFILDRCEAHSRAVSNLSLQKLTFFCHVWSLILLGRPLIKHKFEAWQFGPVLQYLYREFKHFDSSPITARAKCIDPKTGEKRVVQYQFDAEVKAMLENVVDFYSRMSAADLVEISHIEDGPWHKVWHHQGKVNPGMMIDDEQIAEFYSKAPRPYAIQ